MANDLYMNKLRHWARVIETANASNLTRSEWCKKMDISENAFYYWQRRVRKHALDQIADQPEMVCNPPAAAPVAGEGSGKPDFFEIVISDSNAQASPSVAGFATTPKEDTTDTSVQGGITVRFGPFSIDLSEGFSKSAFQSALEVMGHV